MINAGTWRGEALSRRAFLIFSFNSSVSIGCGGQLHEEQYSLVPLPILPYSRAVRNLREFVDNVIDLCGSDSYARGFEYGIGPAEKGNAAGIAEKLDIVAVPPHTRENPEIRVLVLR